MNSILVQSNDSKFIQNICESKLDDVKIHQSIFNDKLYGLYFLNKPTHIIFSSTKLDRECLQFITDYGKDIKVFIYHSNDNEIDLGKYPSYCYHMVHDKVKTVLSTDNLVVIPNKLVNDQLYFSVSKTRRKSIVYFFPRNLTKIPEHVNDMLYPNTKLPILSFHSARTPHPQNMGIVTEKDRGNILRDNEYYLTFDNDEYLNEAVACGSKIVTFEKLVNYENESSILQPETTIKYTDFIVQEILNDK